MAMLSGVTSARAVCKPYSSVGFTSSSAPSGRLVRRRGRGSLVRCRAFVWTKQDLDRLHHLSTRPRNEVAPDVVDEHVPTSSSAQYLKSHPPSLHSSYSVHLQHCSTSRFPSEMHQSQNSSNSCATAAISSSSFPDHMYASIPGLQPPPPAPPPSPPGPCIPMQTSTSPDSLKSDPPTPSPNLPNGKPNPAAVAGIASTLIDLTLET